MSLHELIVKLSVWNITAVSEYTCTFVSCYWRKIENFILKKKYLIIPEMLIDIYNFIYGIYTCTFQKLCKILKKNYQWISNNEIKLFFHWLFFGCVTAMKIYIAIITTNLSLVHLISWWPSMYELVYCPMLGNQFIDNSTPTRFCKYRLQQPYTETWLVLCCIGDFQTNHTWWLCIRSSQADE